MKKNLATAFALISLLIYNYFFWDEKFGINLPFFTLLLGLFLFYLNKESILSKNVIITAAGTFVTGLMVVVQNSDTSKFAHIVSFFLMTGFIHEKQLRSLMSSFLNIVYNYLRLPKTLLKHKLGTPKGRVALRFIKLGIIPLFIAWLFYNIYSAANPVFEDTMNLFFEKLNLWLDNLFDIISFDRFMFLLLGAFLICGIIFKNEIQALVSRDLSLSEKLIRIRKNKRNPGFFNLSVNVLGLKNENRSGMILLLIVNTLLLIENIIDVKLLWFGFKIPAGFSLKSFVHEGTGFLIFSIILSIAILLYYFRRNQNFYSRNKYIKTLAYAWIFQNIVLCVSVYMRNYHYIIFHGLAYLRIGVIIYLALTIIGLCSLYLKIKDTRSSYYLWKTNTWAAFIIMITMTLFNWDVLIIKYNLNHWNTSEIDIDFYFKVSDKALPAIYDNLDKVRTQIETHKHNEVRWVSHLDYDNFLQDLNYKRDRFLAKYKHYTWLSWNIQDQHTAGYFNQKLLSETIK